MPMDLRKLKTLIELVESSGIGELEIQEGEERVRITKAGAAPVAASSTHTFAGAPAGAPVRTRPRLPPRRPEGPSVKSPMVGTFYRAASPGRKAFRRESATGAGRATRSASSRR
jgi:acetyl-CoA carboxylase biotin carboxyl carrier protein